VARLGPREHDALAVGKPRRGLLGAHAAGGQLLVLARPGRQRMNGEFGIGSIESAHLPSGEIAIALPSPRRTTGDRSDLRRKTV
jgi:hypothetical protein